MNPILRFKRAWVAGVSFAMATLCLAHSGAASAQDAQAAEDSGGLQEIVVTAQKRAESLQKVPVSVTAITGDQLAAQKLDDSSSLVTQIPNLQVNGIVGEASPVFSLRGISMFDYSLNQSSPVAGYVDEVYKGNFAIFGVELYDLERVEVLRGPQGTLYGKNTTGGAINFITHKPGFETAGFLSAGFGNFSRKEAQGAFQTALVADKLAARVAFTYTKADGWFKGVNGSPDMDGVDQYGVRLSLLYKANDDVDVLLKLSTSKQKPFDYGILARPGPLGVGGGLYSAFGMEDYAREGLKNDEIETSFHPKREQNTDAIALTINWNLSDSLALTSLTSYDKGKLYNPEDTDGSPVHLAEIPYFGRTRQVAQDLRLTTTGDGAFNYIVGAYYSEEKIFNSTELRLATDIDLNGDGALDFNDCLDVGLDLGGVGCIFGNSFDQKRKSYALYTDTSYQVAEAVKFRLGLRYTDDKGDQYNFVSQLRGNDQVPLANLIPGDPNDLDATASRSLENKKVTGRIGFDVNLSDTNLLYISYSHGYRSGAFNAQAFFGPGELTVVKPESINSWELGLKSQWLDDRVQVNAAIFRLDYRNQQVIDVDPVTLAQPLKNLGKSNVKGAEIELVARPVPAFTLRAALGLLNAKLIDATLRGEDLGGNRLPNAPKLTATLGTQWEAAHWGNASGLTVYVDASYSGSQFFEPFNVARLKQDSYTLLNARVAYHATEALDIAAWGKNLTDKFYITSAADLLSGFGFDYTHRGAPRTFGLEANYKF